jgi:hypothetical protein
MLIKPLSFPPSHSRRERNDPRKRLNPAFPWVTIVPVRNHSRLDLGTIKPADLLGFDRSQKRPLRGMEIAGNDFHPAGSRSRDGGKNMTSQPCPCCFRARLAGLVVIAMISATAVAVAAVDLVRLIAAVAAS